MGRTDFGRRLAIGSSRDELYELGVAFNQLLDRLQQAYERQRRFTGDAAHQLRTPISVLQGQIDVFRRRERTAEEYFATMRILSEHVGELGRIVESLLFLAGSEHESTRPKTEVVDLNAWLTSYRERWKDHPRASDFSVQLSGDATIETGPTLLAQVLDNLINNAFKYSQSSKPVVLRSTLQHDRVTLAVEDHGVGISTEDRNAIFEPFFRSSEARRLGVAGTGLGLAIAARIAKALQGELECTSEAGVGSTFLLHLPLSNPQA